MPACEASLSKSCVPGPRVLTLEATRRGGWSWEQGLLLLELRPTWRAFGELPCLWLRPLSSFPVSVLGGSDMHPPAGGLGPGGGQLHTFTSTPGGGPGQGWWQREACGAGALRGHWSGEPGSLGRSEARDGMSHLAKRKTRSLLGPCSKDSSSCSFKHEETHASSSQGLMLELQAPPGGPATESEKVEVTSGAQGRDGPSGSWWGPLTQQSQSRGSGGRGLSQTTHLLELSPLELQEGSPR